MFTLIEIYMGKAREERRSHLDLNEPCIEIGGDSENFRGLLCHFLKTTMPVGRSTFLCHGCNTQGCSNPSHLYWGTPSDNERDKKSAGTFKTAWQKTVEKHGLEVAREIRKPHCARGGKNNAGKPKSKEHRERISKSLTECKPARSDGLVRNEEDAGSNPATPTNSIILAG